MAKCIQVVGQGVPARVSNEDAFQIVIRDHDGEYCPKHVFKDWHRPKIAAAVLAELSQEITEKRDAVRK